MYVTQPGFDSPRLDLGQHLARYETIRLDKGMFPLEAQRKKENGPTRNIVPDSTGIEH